jgi:hypothetical protein
MTAQYQTPVSHGLFAAAESDFAQTANPLPRMACSAFWLTEWAQGFLLMFGLFMVLICLFSWNTGFMVLPWVFASGSGLITTDYAFSVGGTQGIRDKPSDPTIKRSPAYNVLKLKVHVLSGERIACGTV